MLRIYDTLTRREQEFKPLAEGIECASGRQRLDGPQKSAGAAPPSTCGAPMPGRKHRPKVGMYVCGPTVYSHAHLGHARPAVVFDVIRRYLEYSGYEVKFVSNITDIDDKIIAKANEAGVEIGEVTREYTEDYIEVTRRLGVKEPDVRPYCTEHVPQMIDLVEKIIANGHGYAVNAPDAAEAGAKDVYFDVESHRGYGKLSGRRPGEDDSAFAEHRVEVDARKRHPADFALWKASKPGEPVWDSPWGKGRPGWHIECSAMSHAHLGVPFDIHGGGEDLVFPHHENEIAQAEAGYGTEFARYWIHNAFVTIDSEKMSKSIGNVTNLRDLLEHYDGSEIRFFLLGTHYRSPIDFTPERLDEARAGMERIYNAIEEAQLAQVLVAGTSGIGHIKPVASEAADKARKAFVEGMDADFNTAKARAAIFDLVNWVNGETAYWRKKGTLEEAERPRVQELSDAVAATRELLEVLGLPAERPARAAAEGDLTDDEVDRLAAERRAAREARDFAEADRIRDELVARGVELRDNPDGTTTWKRK